jgi:hypothetical protein
MKRISSWFLDLGRHDAAGPRDHGHHDGHCHVDDDDDDDDVGLGNDGRRDADAGYGAVIGAGSASAADSVDRQNLSNRV